MSLVTLIGDTQARIGNRFYFNGPSTECKECKLRNVCFNLDIGSLYEVVGLRDTRHECKLLEDQVRVVEVEKKAFFASVNKKYAIDGSRISIEKRECDNIGCENYKYCCPSNIKNPDKFTIVKIVEDIKCPLDEKLTLVKIE